MKAPEQAKGPDDGRRPILANFRGAARKVSKSLRRRGVWGTVSISVAHIVNACQVMIDPSKRRQDARSDFDEKFGVETDGVIYLSDLDVSGESYLYGLPYDPSPIGIFRQMMSNLKIDPAEFVFVDLGSGKGRALMLAAERPFRRIVGVEFSRQLHQVAERNIQSFQNAAPRCPHIDLICQDAGEFVFPAENLVVYFYNPFEETVMRKVLQNLGKSLDARPRKAVLLYNHPVCANLFEETGFVKTAATYEYSIYENQ